MVDESGKPIYGEVPSDKEILAHLDRALQSCHEGLLPYQRILFRVPQGRIAPNAERL